MKSVKLKENLYKEAERVSKTYGVKVQDIIPKALKQGLLVLNEKNVLQLYRSRKITLQKAAEMLSIDIWEMIDKMNYPAASGRGIFKSNERPKGRGIKPGLRNKES
ncbi:MAG TPA: hypothetical protein ENH01_12290 [Nitrospirae bacterium]|nr:hypothetical protein [Nitrospirota bacterium]